MEAPHARKSPSRLVVETTTRCNLKCRMCVKQTLDGGVVEGDIGRDTFAALSPAFPNLDALVLSGIGEPLLHPRLDAMIEAAAKAMPTSSWVGFQTNGLLVDGRRAGRLVDAGLGKICVSVDALTPRTFSAIRSGGEVGSVERALTSLAKARGGGRLKIGVEFVAMRDNINELPGVLRWARERGADFAIVTQVLPYDRATVAQAAYDPNTDAAVAFFEPWLCRARAEGVAVERYFDVLWNYKKTGEEQRIVDFVEEMKADAHARDIFVNVQKMLERDPAWICAMREAFEAARETAEEIGLDAWLPEIVPASARKCEFVENSTAFVNWRGEVHPCYFLWHEYRCFINGREKFVLPRVFGKVPEAPLLEIWNSPEFTAFRQAVVKYDYPFCSDCNLAKCCDYVTADEFGQDCYLNAEPCGDCLWCKGVFRCLA